MNPSPLATIPEGLDLLDIPDGVTIRRRWFSWLVIPLALFAVVWDSFLVFWYFAAFHMANSPLIMKIFPLGHVAVGVGITYSVFTTLLNKTDVVITPGTVRVATGPLPWVGNKELSRGDLSEVLVRTRSTGRGGITYKVMYADQGRKERPLLGGIQQADQAEFYAATIRQRLGLRLPAA